MFKLSTICLATLLVLHAPFGVAQTRPATTMSDAALASSIDASLARHFKQDEPGAAVLVTRAGKPLLRKAYGMADVAKGIPMSPDHVLRLGSITKQFTAVAILMLVEDGKLALNDDITRVFPDYPTKGKKISIEHLLTHTSGIVSYTSKPGFGAGLGNDIGVSQMIDTFKNDPLEFEPGTRFKYNNSGYFLLGAVIEKISGMSYAKFLEQRIFIPLGMNDSAYEGHERSQAPRAAGHSAGNKGYTAARRLSMSVPYAGGALVSTVDDMARWDAAITAGKLLKPASWKQAFTSYKLADGSATGYGYGWNMASFKGQPQISHDGRVSGFVSAAMRLPEQQLYVVVLSNSDSGVFPPELIAAKAAAAAMGQPYPDLAPIKLTTEQLDAYTGSYKIDDKSERIIRRAQDQLIMARTGRPPVALIPYSANGFMLDKTLARMEFSRSAGGEVNRVTIFNPDGPTIENARTGPVPPDPVVVQVSHADFDKLAGRYALAPQFILEVSRDGEHFFVQATGQGKIEIHPLSPSLYWAKPIDGKLQFGKSADGKDQLVLTQNGRDQRALRLP
ncbi:MAG: serine hydrolase domain-containing protein [Pseudomonadota bacterium]